MSGVDIYVGLSEGGVATGETPLFWKTYADMPAGIDTLFKYAGETSGGPSWGRRRSARVWLSGALARPFLCGPVDGLSRWRDVVALAHAMAADATGLASPCAVQIEHWPHPHASLAVAVSEQTIEAVYAAGRAHGIAIKSLRPWWAAALNHAISAHGAASLVALTDTDATTLIGGQPGHVDTAAAYVPSPSAEQTEKLLARMALTAGIQPEAAIQWRLREGSDAVMHGVPFANIERQAA